MLMMPVNRLVRTVAWALNMIAPRPRDYLHMTHQPEGIELMYTALPGNWIKDRLWPWTSVEEGMLAGSIIPEGFNAYARVFHPAERRTPDNNRERVTWAAIASWNGEVAHPQMIFNRIAHLEPWCHPTWGRAPFYGNLPEEECRVLVSILERFTSTPERCYFCLWEGYGFLGNRLFKRVPKLKIPGPGGREYLVFRGPLGAIVSFYFYRDVEGGWRGWGQAPNIWWPEDRAWCVATDIDSFDSYVGANKSCIDQVLAHPDLEALPIAVDARIDHLGDSMLP